MGIALIKVGARVQVFNKKGLSTIIKLLNNNDNGDVMFWSSTENSSTNAWIVNFNNGDRWNNNKNNNNYVRPVLAFLL